MAAPMAGDEEFYSARGAPDRVVDCGDRCRRDRCGLVLWGGRAAAGLAAGAVLSWVNYRWMKQGVDTLARLSTAQAGTQRAQVPASVYLKFLGRYALLIVAAYAILRAFSTSSSEPAGRFFFRNCRGSGGNGGAAFPSQPASRREFLKGWKWARDYCGLHLC